MNLTKSSTELKISNPDQWIYRGNYYQYLVSEMGFPLLKIKALKNVVGLENEMMGRMKCFKLVEDSFFDSLLYPLI